MLVSWSSSSQLRHITLLPLLVSLAVTELPGHARGSISEDQDLEATRGLVLRIWMRICLGTLHICGAQEILEDGGAVLCLVCAPHSHLECLVCFSPFL